LFGRPVDAFAGETTTRIVTGLGLAALGLVGLLVVFSVDWLDGRFLVFPAALGAEGLRRAFFAFVNRNVKPTER
ncbi:MAG: hypothetical protein SFW67_10110, partial [Myxococcaceae bacterium]|nr:hypothetical protein [Myxococcaceae bacterium]